MTRKVAIVGSAENWREAPFDDDSWEIWTLNDMFKIVPKSDVYFELHDMSQTKNHTPGEMEWLRNNKTIPVYMMHLDDTVPMARQYPYEDILKEYGRYFTNSISWMIALALHEDDVDEIGIWGVNMAHGTEYAAQKPSCEYFIGLARGRGINVLIPSSSSLLSNGFLYALEESQIGEDVKTRATNLRAYMEQTQNEKNELAIREAKVAGAIEILDYILVTYGG